MDFEKVGKDTYKLYVGLRNGGFTDGHSLGLLANFLQSVYFQYILREEAEFKIITNGFKK